MLRKVKVCVEGESVAVRLPHDIWMGGSEVCVKKEGNRIVLIPTDRIWDELFDRLEEAEDLLRDFLSDRDQLTMQRRELF